MVAQLFIIKKGKIMDDKFFPFLKVSDSFKTYTRRTGLHNKG